MIFAQFLLWHGVFRRFLLILKKSNFSKFLRSLAPKGSNFSKLLGLLPPLIFGMKCCIMGSMIAVRCETADALPLCRLSPFQGSLKSRSAEQLEELRRSILEEGLLAPFFVWKGTVHADEGERNWLVDGHARLEALRLEYEETGDDGLWFGQEFPVVYIEASDPDDAKRALLQVTSSYGKITAYGAKKFCASLPGYRAPSVAAFLKPVKADVGVAGGVSEKAAPPAEGKASSGDGEAEAEITIAVPYRYKDDVLRLFGTIGYVRVVRHG